MNDDFEKLKEYEANTKVIEAQIRECELIIKEKTQRLSEKNELIKRNQEEIKDLKYNLEKYKKLEKSFIRFFIHYLKKLAYRIAFRLYKIFESKPRLLRFFLRVNNKLGIIKDYKRVLNMQTESKQFNQIRQSDKGIKGLNVAMIADEFTYNCFKYEFNAHPLTPENWQEVFSKQKPNLFFCESAWSGADPIVRPWKGKIYSSINFKYENRLVLLEILEYCKKHKIPTVFWNKEDPIHYIDKVHNFVDTAIKFDHIFTSAEECVEKYKNDYKHPSVHALMFATQPKMFNPIEEYERTDEIIFAGSWYAQHPDRCVEMEKIFDSIIASKHKLKIFDRHSWATDPNHFFPEKYKQYVFPKLNYEELSLAYKGSKYALNINTSTDSETMFARRVFELMSSNTCVLSNYSHGMEKLFGENVFFVNDGIEIKNEDVARETNLYNVLEYHTYTNRFKQILNDIGFAYDSTLAPLQIFRVIENESQIDAAVEAIKLINYENKKGVLLLSDKIENTRIKDIFVKYNSNEIDVVSLDYLKKYDRELSFNGYFIFVDNDVTDDFISKSMLHFCYLDTRTGVLSGENKYTFVDDSSYINTVFGASLFDEVLDTVKGKASNVVFKKYII